MAAGPLSTPVGPEESVASSHRTGTVQDGMLPCGVHMYGQGRTLRLLHSPMLGLGG